ncbi:hypothetical protein NDU88_000953 [Pleurodeles waltl]|uniref:Uncharacterized protein n=1 Tax=Pleurodeles waltl TaxID=8319 RepID=A0AAV7MIB3_PLEWA|nr:hypothetical protein NDU88_000953 [Pleurodeles waltl]
MGVRPRTGADGSTLRPGFARALARVRHVPQVVAIQFVAPSRLLFTACQYVLKSLQIQMWFPLSQIPQRLVAATAVSLFIRSLVPTCGHRVTHKEREFSVTASPLGDRKRAGVRNPGRGDRSITSPWQPQLHMPRTPVHSPSLQEIPGLLRPITSEKLSGVLHKYEVQMVLHLGGAWEAPVNPGGGPGGPCA